MPFENKSVPMADFLEKMFGTETAMKKGLCVTCGKPVGEFKDALSERESKISGMCQECQDSVFGADDEF